MQQILIKGMDRLPQPLGVPSWVEVGATGKRIKRGVQLWPVCASCLKGEFYAWLKTSAALGGFARPGTMYQKGGPILLRKWLSDGRPGWGYAALGTSMTS